MTDTREVALAVALDALFYDALKVFDEAPFIYFEEATMRDNAEA